MFEVIPERELHSQNPHQKRSDAWFAWNQLRRLERICVQGLPDCYKGKLTSFWYDFYPDFSWDGRLVQQIELMLADSGFDKLERSFYLSFGCSLRDELSRARDQVASGNWGAQT